jgi:hypothetical protein
LLEYQEPERNPKREKLLKFLNKIKYIYISGFVLSTLLSFVATHNVLLSLVKGLLSWGYVIYFIIRMLGM